MDYFNTQMGSEKFHACFAYQEEEKNKGSHDEDGESIGDDRGRTLLSDTEHVLDLG